MAKRRRSVRMVPHRHTDGALPAHRAYQASDRIRPALHSALFPWARASRRRRRRECRSDLEPVAMDAAIRLVEGSTRALSLAGELPASGLAKRPVAVLRGPGQTGT